jgi:hypothetical protein
LPTGTNPSTDRATNFEVGVLGVRRFAAGDSGGFENAANVQGHVVYRSSLSAKREGLLVKSIMEARVGLGRVLRGAIVMQKEFIEASGGLHGFCSLCFRRDCGRNPRLCRSNLAMAATNGGKEKSSQYSRQ